MAKLLGQEVPLVSNWLDGVYVRPGQVVILENCRTNVGERRDDEALSRAMARLCDIYVNDAPKLIGWVHSSNHGIALHAQVACAGPLLCEALDAATALLAPSRRPLVAVLGGSSIYVKIDMLSGLSETVDTMIIGGALANSFLLAMGLPVGRSLAEPSMLAELRDVVTSMWARGAQVLLPEDVVTAHAFASDAVATTRPVEEVGASDMILDIGPCTTVRFCEAIQGAGSLIWYGCMGIDEFPSFAQGTRAVAQAVGRSRAVRVVVNIDTMDALGQFAGRCRAEFSMRGTSGLQALLESRRLPVIEALARAED